MSLPLSAGVIGAAGDGSRLWAAYLSNSALSTEPSLALTIAAALLAGTADVPHRQMDCYATALIMGLLASCCQHCYSRGPHLIQLMRQRPGSDPGHHIRSSSHGWGSILEVACGYYLTLISLHWVRERKQGFKGPMAGAR